MRTYERGVGPTLGCGSAALSVFILTHKLNGTKKATIQQPGGTVTLRIENQRISMHGKLPGCRICHIMLKTSNLSGDHFRLNS